MKRPDGPDRTAWSARWRVGISVLIIAHLWAVVGRPLEFATQGPTGVSPAASAFYAPVRGYSEAAFLNHGYAFFAPNPGPSHLLRVEAEMPDGDARTYLYPDLKRQWPRLLYHRHFMLTEFLHNTYHPPTMPPEVAEVEAAAQQWRLDRQRFEAVRGSMRRHLEEELETDQLTMRRVEHRLAGLPEFLEGGMPIDAPELYIELADEPGGPAAEQGGPRNAPPNYPAANYPAANYPAGSYPDSSPANRLPSIPRFGAPRQFGPAFQNDAPQREAVEVVPRGNMPGSGR